MYTDVTASRSPQVTSPAGPASRRRLQGVVARRGACHRWPPMWQRRWPPVSGAGVNECHLGLKYCLKVTLPRPASTQTVHAPIAPGFCNSPVTPPLPRPSPEQSITPPATLSHRPHPHWSHPCSPHPRWHDVALHPTAPQMIPDLVQQSCPAWVGVNSLCHQGDVVGHGGDGWAGLGCRLRACRWGGSGRGSGGLEVARLRRVGRLHG